MTNAGALLLGKEGSRYLISATITCACFRGRPKPKILDQKIFDGVILQFQQCLALSAISSNTEYIIKIKRTEKLELPEMLCEKRSSTQSPTAITALPPIFRFTSFTTASKSTTPGSCRRHETFRSSATQRSPQSAAFRPVYRMDLVENVGSGLKRIRDTMKENGLDEPVIEADEHWFTVTFHREREGRPTSSPDVEEPATRAKTRRKRIKTRVKTGKKILGIIKGKLQCHQREIAELTGISLKGIDWQLSRNENTG